VTTFEPALKDPKVGNGTQEGLGTERRLGGFL